MKTLVDRLRTFKDKWDKNEYSPDWKLRHQADEIRKIITGLKAEINYELAYRPDRDIMSKDEINLFNLHHANAPHIQILQVRLNELESEYQDAEYFWDKFNKDMAKEYGWPFINAVTEWLTAHPYCVHAFGEDSRDLTDQHIGMWLQGYELVFDLLDAVQNASKWMPISIDAEGAVETLTTLNLDDDEAVDPDTLKFEASKRWKPSAEEE